MRSTHINSLEKYRIYWLYIMSYKYLILSFMVNDVKMYFAKINERVLKELKLRNAIYKCPNSNVIEAFKLMHPSRFYCAVTHDFCSCSSSVAQAHAPTLSHYVTSQIKIN